MTEQASETIHVKLTPTQLKTLQELADAQGETLDWLIGKLAEMARLQLAQIKEGTGRGAFSEQILEAAVRSAVLTSARGADLSLLDPVYLFEVARHLAKAAESLEQAKRGGHEPIPPYEWSRDELEAELPVRYVPGRGLVIEERPEQA